MKDLDEAEQQQIWEHPDWFIEKKRNGVRCNWYMGGPGDSDFRSRNISVKTFTPDSMKEGLFWLDEPGYPEYDGTVLDGEVISTKKKVDTSKFTRSGGGVTNNVLQACVAAETKIITNRGILSIGDVYNNWVVLCRGQSFKIWTGRRWAPFKVLDMGDKPLMRVKLADGRFLECDEDHEILVSCHNGDKNSGVKVTTSFKKVKDIRKYHPVCVMQPIKGSFRNELVDLFACGSSWNSKTVEVSPSLRNEFYYWMGRYFGDGYGDGSRVVWCFGDHEYGDAEKLVQFLDGIGISATPVWGDRAWKVCAISKPLCDLYRDCGVLFSQKARTKRVPQGILGGRYAIRLAFVRGFLDSDGYKLRGIFFGCLRLLAIGLGCGVRISAGLDS